MKRLITPLLITALAALALPAVALAKMECPNWVMHNGTPEAVHYGPRAMNESITSPNPGEVQVHVMPHAGYEPLLGAGPYGASGFQFWVKPLSGWLVLYRQTLANQIPEYGPWVHNLTFTSPEWRELPFPEGQLGEGQTWSVSGLPAGKYGFFYHQSTEIKGPALVHDPFLELMRDEVTEGGSSGRGVCENETGTPPGVLVTVGELVGKPLRAAKAR